MKFLFLFLALTLQSSFAGDAYMRAATDDDYTYGDSAELCVQKLIERRIDKERETLEEKIVELYLTGETKDEERAEKLKEVVNLINELHWNEKYNQEDEPTFLKMKDSSFWSQLTKWDFALADRMGNIHPGSIQVEIYWEWNLDWVTPAIPTPNADDYPDQIRKVDLSRWYQLEGINKTLNWTTSYYCRKVDPASHKNDQSLFELRLQLKEDDVLVLNYLIQDLGQK